MHSHRMALFDANFISCKLMFPFLWWSDISKDPSIFFIRSDFKTQERSYSSTLTKILTSVTLPAPESHPNFQYVLPCFTLHLFEMATQQHLTWNKCLMTHLPSLLADANHITSQTYHIHTKQPAIQKLKSSILRKCWLLPYSCGFQLRLCLLYLIS